MQWATAANGKAERLFSRTQYPGSLSSVLSFNIFSSIDITNLQNGYHLEDFSNLSFEIFGKRMVNFSQSL